MDGDGAFQFPVSLPNMRNSTSDKNNSIRITNTIRELINVMLCIFSFPIFGERG